MRCDRGAAGLGDLLDNLVGHRDVFAVAAHGSADVVDDYRCSPLRQLDGVDAAESAARPGHDGDLACEVDHGPSAD
jgi:hypothetical protein